MTQLVSAAVREGSLRIAEQPTLELVTFWFFPIVLGSVVLVAASLVRGRTGWRENDPDPPGTAGRSLARAEKR